MCPSPHSQTPVTKDKKDGKSIRKYRQLYIIGDSISLGYMIPLWYEQFTASTGNSGICTITHSPGGGTSTVVRTCLDDWIAGYCPDVILFNCGLHDIGRYPTDLNVPLERYEANLQAIVMRLQQILNPAGIIWARTTPVIDERHNNSKSFVRYNSDVSTYNEVADTIMDNAGIMSVDLYGTVMANNIENILTDDGVHYTQDGYKLLAQSIWASIRQLPGLEMSTC